MTKKIVLRPKLSLDQFLIDEKYISEKVCFDDNWKVKSKQKTEGAVDFNANL